MADGSIPRLDRGGVVTALAAEAGSSTATERLRTSAMHGVRLNSRRQSAGPALK
jgi:hypothetical protein